MNRSAIAILMRATVCLASIGLMTSLAVPAVAQAPPASAQAPPTGTPEQQAPPTETTEQQAPPTETTEQQDPTAPEGPGVEWTRGWSYGARGVLSWLREDNLDLGLGFSGFAVLQLSTDFELEGEIGYQTMTSIATAGVVVGNGLPEGRLSTFPLRATMRVQLWRFGGAKPYANAGVGMYINRFTLDPAVERDLADMGLAAAATVDPGFGLHAGGGVEWQRGNAHFGFDVKYVFAETDAATIVVDQVSGQVSRETSILDLDGFWIAAGLRYAF